MKSPILKVTSLFPYLLLMLMLLQSSVEGRILLSLSKPDPNDAAAYARWLVSQNSWGVLNTISPDLGGAPFGNVVSYSDGLPGKGAGIPYFYLTTLDPTAAYALKDPRSSFTISEYQIGTCGEADPENPTCAKITLTGQLILVDAKSKEAEFARSALFAKHREMKDWPESHNWKIFKLEIKDIFMINWFGGAKPLTVDQYLRWNMHKSASSCCSVEGRLLKLSLSKPNHEDVVAYARWLVSQNSWGVLSTIYADLGGAPFGNLMSYSDGLPGEGAGVPYFYLTTLDPTETNALEDQRSSMAISEYPIGACGTKDPQSPTCARITLTGKLKLVDADSKEAESARSFLFTKHPVMKHWPAWHNLQVFKQDIENIFIVNWFGGQKPVTVDQYLNWKINHSFDAGTNRHSLCRFLDAFGFSSDSGNETCCILLSFLCCSLSRLQ